MEIEKVVERIAQYRSNKGFSYENMADELNLTTAGYRKIETGETKLTVERLFKIAEILETPLQEFLDFSGVTFQQNNNSNQNVYQQSIEHFYQENREITGELIRAKDKLIEKLEGEIQFFKSNFKKSNLQDLEL